MDVLPELYHLRGDEIFPNNALPALLYKGVLDVPVFFPGTYVKQLFEDNDWSNAWKSGIFEYQHYHSVTHEALGVYEGKTVVQLGGEKGIQLLIEKGDVLILPAGVAHKNLGKEHQLKCVGAYPNGRPYDMNYGKEEERPQADKNIALVPLPLTDPVYGYGKGVARVWANQ